MPDDRAEVVIAGAGPAGLATAAALAARGVRARLIDRTGAVGGAYARMEPTIQLTSPAAIVGLPGLAPGRPDRGAYVSAAAYHAYLVRYAAHHGLAPEPAEVLAVDADGRGLTVTLDGDRRVRARALVIATGMFDFPRRPEIPGLPADATLAPAWRVGRTRPGERVLVVGAASSGVEIAEVEAAAGARVIVAARDPLRLHAQTTLGVDPARLLFPLLAHLPRALARRFCAGALTLPGVDHGFTRLRRAGAIEVRPALVRIDGDRAGFADGRVARFDRVVLATGYAHATRFLPAALARDPRVWRVGARCAHSPASQFLYGIARDAPAVAAALAERLRGVRGAV